MKSLVNQKLPDFNIKGALQILSGDKSFLNPSKESLDILQQKHPQAPPNLMLAPSPSAATPPTYFSQIRIHAAISSLRHGSGAGPEGLRPQHLKETAYQSLQVMPALPSSPA